MKVILEHDDRYDRWYVWTKPSTFAKYFYRDVRGTVLLGSGATSMEALAEAQKAVLSGKLEKRQRTFQEVELGQPRA